jgi:DNA-directed RNA polymerase specialized sigma subunit
MNTMDGNMTQKQVAEALGISRGRVAQIEKQALNKLSKNKKLKQYLEDICDTRRR